MEKLSLISDIKNRLPLNDPKYIAFKELKGILGEIDINELHEERADEMEAMLAAK